MERRKAAKPGRPATEIQVSVEIRPGATSPAQKQAWKRFWQKLIAEAKSEAKNE
jgi:hypothetical protein